MASQQPGSPAKKRLAFTKLDLVKVPHFSSGGGEAAGRPELPPMRSAGTARASPFASALRKDASELVHRANVPGAQAHHHAHPQHRRPDARPQTAPGIRFHPVPSSNRAAGKSKATAGAPPPTPTGTGGRGNNTAGCDPRSARPVSAGAPSAASFIRQHLADLQRIHASLHTLTPRDRRLFERLARAESVVRVGGGRHIEDQGTHRRHMALQSGFWALGAGVSERCTWEAADIGHRRSLSELLLAVLSEENVLQGVAGAVPPTATAELLQSSGRQKQQGASLQTMLPRFERFLRVEQLLDSASAPSVVSGGRGGRRAGQRQKHDGMGNDVLLADSFAAAMPGSVNATFAAAIAPLPVGDLAEVLLALLAQLPGDMLFPTVCEQLFDRLCFATRQRVLVATIVSSPARQRNTIIHSSFRLLGKGDRSALVQKLLTLLPSGRKNELFAPVLASLPPMHRRRSLTHVEKDHVEEMVQGALDEMKLPERLGFVRASFLALVDDEREEVLLHALRLLNAVERKDVLLSLLECETRGDMQDVVVGATQKLSTSQKRGISAQLMNDILAKEREPASSTVRSRMKKLMEPTSPHEEAARRREHSALLLAVLSLYEADKRVEALLGLALQMSEQQRATLLASVRAHTRFVDDRQVVRANLAVLPHQMQERAVEALLMEHLPSERRHALLQPIMRRDLAEGSGELAEDLVKRLINKLPPEPRMRLVAAIVKELEVSLARADKSLASALLQPLARPERRLFLQALVPQLTAAERHVLQHWLRAHVEEHQDGDDGGDDNDALRSRPASPDVGGNGGKSDGPTPRSEQLTGRNEPGYQSPRKLAHSSAPAVQGKIGTSKLARRESTSKTLGIFAYRVEQLDKDNKVTVLKSMLQALPPQQRAALRNSVIKAKARKGKQRSSLSTR